MEPRNSGLSVGDVLNRVFDLYKEHFGVLIPAAFWLFLLVSILSGIVGQHSVGPAADRRRGQLRGGDPLSGDGRQPRP